MNFQLINIVANIGILAIYVILVFYIRRLKTGVCNVYIKDHYAYVINTKLNTLVIFDVSTPNRPVKISETTI